MYISFSIIAFIQKVLYIFFSCTYIYIYSALMNISAIYNKAHKCSLGRNIRSI
jgi:hypothetical protein